MLAAGAAIALCKQSRDERENEQNRKQDRKHQPLDCFLLIRAVQREAEAQRERADHDTDDEARKTDKRVQVAAAEPDDHAQRAAEEHEPADHHEHAEQESHKR